MALTREACAVAVLATAGLQQSVLDSASVVAKAINEQPTQVRCWSAQLATPLTDNATQAEVSSQTQLVQLVSTLTSQLDQTLAAERNTAATSGVAVLDATISTVDTKTADDSGAVSLADRRNFRCVLRMRAPVLIPTPLSAGVLSAQNDLAALTIRSIVPDGNVTVVCSGGWACLASASKPRLLVQATCASRPECCPATPCRGALG